jgi:site-specific recombinase XerD
MRYRRTKGGGKWVELKRGLSASACNHRRTALLHLFTILDGKSATNPVRAVEAFVEPPPEPRGRPIELISRIVARVPSPKSQARLKVLMWTGMRGNCELGKMTPDLVDLSQKICYVPTAKGGRQFRIIPLNDDGVAAWREFIAAKAWGEYDKEGLRSALTRAAKKEMKAAALEKREIPNVTKLRVYDLRHSVATELLKNGADLADVQEFLGHTTPRMTRRYAPFQRAKLAAAVERLKTSA